MDTMSSIEHVNSTRNKSDITIQGSTYLEELTMYQPVTCNQILMADNSNCLALHAYLKMCNLKYRIIENKSAEEMSPTGQVPFIKLGDMIITQFEKITDFLYNKGIALNEELGTGTDEKMIDSVVYISLIDTVLYQAETRLVWFEFWAYSRWRVGHMYPWPLNWYVSHIKRNCIIQRQKILGWYCKSLDQVYKEIDSCLLALSDRLGENKYFFGDKPSKLDALVFGHLFSMLTTPLPAKTNKLAEIVRVYPKLIKLCQTVDKEIFKGLNQNKIY